jgi:hypothetical protein
MKSITTLITALLFAQTVDAATVQVTGVPGVPVMLSDSFTVNIVGADFPITQGGGFNLSYDASILHATSVSIDEINTWTFVNDNGTIDNEIGVINDVIVSDFPGVTDDFTVASVEFVAVGNGTTNLSLTESDFNPWASDGNTISPTMYSDSSVQVVPIPATFLLLGSGLLSMIGLSKRQIRGMTKSRRIS